MVKKKSLLALLAFFNIFLCAYCQEENNNIIEGWQVLNYFVEDSKDILYCEVVIQSYSEKGEWENVRLIKAPATSSSVKISPLLEPGHYRYKVNSYDYIDRLYEGEQWYLFNIIKAQKPIINQITSNATHTATIYLEEENDGIFTVEGHNLFSAPKDKSSIEWTQYMLYLPKAKLVPLILEEDEKARHIKLQFDMKDIGLGHYKLVAKDASGLTSDDNEKSYITVKYKKWYDLDISLGYSISYIQQDSTFLDYTQAKFWPTGIYARACFLPIKKRWGYLGAGLKVNYCMTQSSTQNYDTKAQLFDIIMSLVYQKTFRKAKKQIATIELHAGGGVTGIKDLNFTFPNDYVSENLSSLNESVQGGIALQFYITKRIFLEATGDYTYSFLQDMKLGYITVALGIGYQF